MSAFATFRAELAENIESDKPVSSDGDTVSSEDGTDGEGNTGNDLPSLDERSQTLAALHEESRPSGAFANAYAPPRPSLMKRVGTVFAILIVVIVLGVGGFGVYSAIHAPETEGPSAVVKPTFPPNRAPGLLEEGKLLEALNAAQDAVALNPSERNKAIQEEVRNAIAAKVEEYLTGEAWSPESLDQASQLVTQASIIAPTEFFQDLEEEVKREEYAYKMMLVRPEPERGRGVAKFRLHSLSEAARKSGKEYVTVNEGEEFAGRFRLAEVGRSEAVVVDLLRNRRLVYYLSGNFALVN
ncbi:MAG: hypothetical protein R6V12_16140 [Candidatus Hydrogenedentota bacterium]